MRTSVRIMSHQAPFPEDQFREAVARALCWSDVLRELGYETKGHNIRTVQRWAQRWQVSTEHFDADRVRALAGRRRAQPLQDVLIEGSTYSRGKLKERLIREGLKRPVCEMCGQGEKWHGAPMSMVLDHVNGQADDNRLENLRIVCPNCNATLDTHCGRNMPRQRVCPSCQEAFVPRDRLHRYCTERCWGVDARRLYLGVPHPEARRVPRPSLEQLQADIESMSMVAVGKKYGVSDNAVRKWLRWYEREQERVETSEPITALDARTRPADPETPPPDRVAP
jgi:hypothetical protein